MKLTAVVWAIGTALLGVLVLPVYLANRPLRSGEIREGGFAWNSLKNFAILWTIVIAIAALVGLKAAGMSLGAGPLAALWFVPTIGAAVLGSSLKKNTAVETGPTGPLAGNERKAPLISGWVGIVCAGIVAVVALSVTSSTSHASVAHPSLAPAAPSSWQVTDIHTGARQVTLQIDAQAEIDGAVGKNKPSLAIRCTKQQAQVYIQASAPFEGDRADLDSTTVLIKLDNNAPQTQRWTEASNHEAASPDPSELVSQLTRSKTLQVEFTPLGKRATTATFNMHDLKDALEPFSDACGLN